MGIKRWQDWANVILGLWMVVSPWILGFAADQNPTMNAVIIGVLVTAFGVWAMLMDTAIQKWWHARHPTQ